MLPFSHTDDGKHAHTGPVSARPAKKSNSGDLKATP